MANRVIYILKRFTTILFIASVVTSCTNTGTGNTPVSDNEFTKQHIQDIISDTDSLMGIGEFHEAISKLRSIESFVEKNDTSAYIKVLFRLGTSYSNIELPAKALPYFHKGAETGKILKDSLLTMQFMANKAILYSSVYDTTNALKIFRSILNQFNNTDNKTDLAPVKNSMGKIFRDNYRLDTALLLYKEALEDEKNPLHRAGIYNNIGTIYRLTEQYNKAHKYTDIAISMAKKSNRNDNLIFFFCNKVRIHIKENKLSHAARYIDSIKVLYDSTYQYKILKNYLEIQTDFYTASGRYKEALDVMTRYQKKESEDQKINRSLQFYNAIIENQTRDKQQKIDRFKTQSRIDNLQLKNQQSVIVFTIIIIALLVISLIQIVKRHNKVNRLNRSLVKKNLVLLKENDTDKSLLNTDIKRDVKTVDINPELRSKLLIQLNNIENSTTILRDPELSVDKLARSFNTNQRYLSAIINEEYNCNFSSFINQKRIKESCRLFMQEKYRNYTIEAIASEVGFSNKATFNRAFKRYTDVTPSVFRKHCNNSESDS
jgi:AraC-like DNA-binding protein